MKQSLFHRQLTKQGQRLEPDKENTAARGLSWVHLGGTTRPVNNFAWLTKPTLGTRVFHTILEFGRGCFLSCKLACLVLEMLEANQGPTLDFLPFKLRIRLSQAPVCAD